MISLCKSNPNTSRNSIITTGEDNSSECIKKSQISSTTSSPSDVSSIYIHPPSSRSTSPYFKSTVSKSQESLPRFMGPFPYPHSPKFAASSPAMFNFVASALGTNHVQYPSVGMLDWIPGLHASHYDHHQVALSHPLYPWLFTKRRFDPGAELPGFLLQSFRKPKRIRTAFSPSQLLRLEHAFQRNHYVVGAERKLLANSLSLSETQVKVWFQNRRTKHKRIQENPINKFNNVGGGGSKGTGVSSSISTGSSAINYSSGDDNEIIMDVDYSDEEDMHCQLASYVSFPAYGKIKNTNNMIKQRSL